MNKCIILTVQPQWLHKILTGKKTIEIRKSMPKCEYPIDVYLYCTKKNVNLYKVFREVYMYFDMGVAEPFEDFKYYKLDEYDYSNKGKARFEIENGFYDELYHKLNGKIVAKFTLNKVERIKLEYTDHPELGYGINENCGDDWYEWESDDLLEKCCLTYDELYRYGNHRDIYAWHIYNLQIFDKPMELREFYRNNFDKDEAKPCNRGKYCEFQDYDYVENQPCCGIDYDGSTCPFLKVQRPPQSWCYAYKEE